MVTIVKEYIMKKYLFVISLAMIFILGCGSSGNSDTISNNTQKNPAPSKIFNEPMVKMVQSFNVENVISVLQTLNKDNYKDIYKKAQSFNIASFRELNATFDLQEFTQTSSKEVEKNQKLIYEDKWRRHHEYNCATSGTVSKNIKIIPRGSLRADTYIAGDNTDYVYSKCNQSREIYNGKVSYSVNSFTKFDYRFGAIPLGEFDSSFQNFSVETDTKKITYNGTIRFLGEARYTPEPNAVLTDLSIKYNTVGDFVITIEDKMTGENTKLTYDGLLEYTQYTKNGNTKTATSRGATLNMFNYKKEANYFLHIKNGEESVTTKIYNNIPGVVNADGSISLRASGYFYNNSSYSDIGLDRISNTILPDGTSRYMFDHNTDTYTDASSIEGEVKYALPPSNDINLMDGVIVIGFDTCPATTALRNTLNDLNISHTYINTEESQANYEILDWFGVNYVPYLGVKGNYVAGAFYNNNIRGLTSLLSRYNYIKDDTLIKKHRGESASVYFNNEFESFQSKHYNKHTAIAVAYDTPYQAKGIGWTAGASDRESAKGVALSECAKRRKKYKVKGKCQIYSVDGVKEEAFR